MSVDEHMRRLSQHGARDRLAERERYRLVQDAYRQGMSQRRISGCLGTLSQATITRMLQNAAANPQLVRETPAEIIDRCVAGLISSDEMMSQLRNWDYMVAVDGVARDQSASTCAADDWGGIKQAFYRGLLSDEQFSALANCERGERYKCPDPSEDSGTR